MSRLSITIICCLPLLVSAGNFYKWTDAKGVVHYTDKPHQDAEVLTLPDAPPAPPEAPYSSQGDGGENEDAADTGTAYSKFSIAKPEQDETIRSNEGVVSASLFVTPALQAGHKIVVTLNGQKLKDKLASTQFTLKDLPRGTHSLKADIVNAEGQTLASTNVVSFHLRKTSLLHPKPKR